MLNRTRILSLLLTAVVTVTAIPTVATASNGETYQGEVVTTRVANVTDERTQLFNEGWKFYKGNPTNAQAVSFNDSAWRNVDLPHDFSIEEDFSTSYEAESGFLPGGTGWYRKAFVMPTGSEGKTVVLDFDGVYNDTTVYVNGTQVGTHVYGYTPFGYDISDYLNYDGSENIIAVKVVHQYPSSRWYSGSGIYRNVYLTITDAVHVDYNGTKVTTPNLESQKNGNVTVNIEADIANDSSESASVVVKNTVYNSEGVQVSSTASTTITVSADAQKTVSQSVTVNKPELWSVDSPTLYKVVTEVTSGEQRDTYETEFGFRYFSFSKSNGFSLNGEKMKIKGVCMHHDQGALGAAAYEDAIARQLDILKDMGCNLIRVSHNPASRELISLCNEKGFLVIEEAFDTWKNPKNGNVNDYSKYFAVTMDENPNMFGYEKGVTWAEYDVKSMADRDKNAPSIILWSIGNEVLEGINGSTDDYASVAQNLIDWIQEVDTTRPTTFGDNKLKDNRQIAIDIANVIHNEGGIIGLNYSSDYQYDNINNSRDWILMGSETSSAVNSRGYYKVDSYSVDNATREMTAYDTSAVSWGRTAISSWHSVITRDAIAGEAVWTGFDYIGEPTPWNGTSAGATTSYGASPNSSYFGIVDTAGFPKDTYYYYQSQWNDAVNTLHIVPGSWNKADLEVNSNKVLVHVYSDAAAVELFLNGQSLGKKSFTEYTTNAGFKYRLCNGQTYLSWDVTYAEGTLSAVAYDSSGKVISNTEGTDTVSTVYSAKTLSVSANKTTMEADGQSLSYLEINIPDSYGNPVNSAEPELTVTLSGEGVIAGVDNGDASEIDKFQNTISDDGKSATISAYHGKALVIVKSGTIPGNININISAGGYSSASASIETTATDSDSGISAESYSMIKEYTVAQGTKPVLSTDATVTLKDGSVVTGTISWEEIAADTYGIIGNHTLKGTLTYQNESMPVSATLVVIAQVAAIKNYSTVTAKGCLPTLPEMRPGIMANGTESGEFAVTWNMPVASAFNTVGSVVTVNGTAEILGQTMPVTATVRVAENDSAENVALKATAGADKCYEDYPERAIDGVNNKKGYTSWTGSRNYSSSSFWLTWTEETVFDYLLLYLRNDEVSADSMLPTKIEIYTSENATQPYKTVTSGITAGTALKVNMDYVQTDYIKLVFHYTVGKWIMLDEVEAYNFVAEQYSSAVLESIAVTDTEISVENGVYEYSLEVEDLDAATVEAVAVKENAAATILPKMDTNNQYIVVESEDNSRNQIYHIAYTEKEVIEPAPEVGVLETASLKTASSKILLGEKTTLSLYDVYLSDGTDATYTCNAELKVISGSAQLDGFELTGTEVGKVVVKATVTLGGVSIDTNEVVILVEKPGPDTTELQELVSESATYATSMAAYKYTTASYNNIVVVRKEAITVLNANNATQEQVDVACEELRNAIKNMETKKVPVPEVSLEKDGNRFKITGKNAALVDESGEFCEVVEHGILYITKSRLGAKSFNVNTSGRTKVSFTGHYSDGTYVYYYTPPKATTEYAVVSYARYYNAKGKLVYTYSPIETAALSDL